MNDLGTKGESEYLKPEKPDETRYPTLCIYGKAVDEFLGGQKVELGDEFEVKLKVRVSGMRKDKHSQSLDLEVLESEELDLEEKSESEDEDAD